MRHLIKLTVISVALASSFGWAVAQNTPTPKAEDAEKNAFQTPTAGKNAEETARIAKGSTTDANPESRMSDKGPGDKVGAPNTMPK